MNFTKNNQTTFEKITKNLIAPAVLALIGLACSLFGGNTPSAVFKSFVSAAKSKDVSAMKQYLSDDALKSLKDSAQTIGKTEDEILAAASEKFTEMPEISNEKIDDDGKTASLEAKTKDKTETIYFVKDGSWKLNFEKPKEKSAETVKNSPTPDSSTTAATPQDTSPVTISASSLIDEAMSSSEALEKYRGRMMTVTDAELWEIQYSMLHIGEKYGSYASGYIICSGSFSEYMPYSSKIADLKRAGKAPGATIKGTFSKVVRDSGYTQVHLDPCVLSNLEK